MKKFTSIFIIVVFILCIANSLFAQRFKDIYPIIKSDSTPFSRSQRLLTNYIAENPLEAFAHYNYALLCKKHINDFDVLMDTELCLKYAKLALTHFKLANNYFDKKEPDRNMDYYKEYIKLNAKGKPYVDFDEVKQSFASIIHELELYIQYVPDISFQFHKSVDYYLKAKNIFAKLNNDYRTLNELLMLADDEVVNQLNQLINYYDSASYYINNYQQSIQTFPIEKYKQKFIVKQIQTYRLDGFEEKSSFMLPEIILWDYAAWAKQVLSQLSRDIIDLMLDIERAVVELNDGINLLKSNQEVLSLPQEYKLNKTLVQKIKKFDANSLMLQFLHFEKNYLDLLIAKRNPLIADTSKATAFEKFNFHNKIFNAIIKTDSLNKAVIPYINEVNYKKYDVVLDKIFKNQAGLSEYLSNCKTDLSKDLEKFGNLSWQYIKQNELLFTDTTKYIAFKGKQVPLFVSNYEEFTKSEFKTIHIKQDIDGSIYLCGYYHDGALARSVGYFGKITNNKLVWMKTFENRTMNSYTMDFSLQNENITILNVCKHDTGSVYQYTLIKFDKTGKEKENQKGTNNLFPQRFAVFPHTNEYILASFADSPVNNMLNNNELNIQWLTPTLSKMNELSYMLDGDIRGIVIVDKKAIVFGNYSKFIMSNPSKTISEKAGNTNAYGLCFDTKGNLLNMQFKFFEGKAKFVQAICFDNENINIIGAINPKPLDYLGAQTENVYYIKTNSSLKPFYTNQ